MAGGLILHGGNEFQKGCEPIDRFALEKLRPDESALLILAFGTGFAPNYAQSWFRQLNAPPITTLLLSDMTTATDPQICQQIAAARLIYLPSPATPEILAGLPGTPFEVALRQAARQEAVIVGAGYGGMLLAEQIYQPQSGQLIKGINALAGAAFIPAYNRQGRKWAEQARQINPTLKLFCADERVAIAGRGSEWQVVGRGWVTIFPVEGTPKKFQGGQPIRL